MSSTAYGKTKNNQSQINKNLFEDEGILSFIKSFDNSNSAIINLVIKKDNDNLSSNQYIKGSQSFFEDSDNISEVDDDKITKHSEDKFEKKSTKIDINNQNNFESINQQNYKINGNSFNEIGAIKGTKNSNLDNSQIQKIKQEKKGMIFSAQKVSIDNELQTLIATGNVKLELDNIKLSSKEIIYYKNKDEIHAKGNVFLQDENGNFHNGEDLILKNQTSNFYLSNIYAQLADGSQMTARNVVSENKNEIKYKGTKFTPCNCKLNEGQTPLWHFSARETRVNNDTHTIHHDGVTMHLLNFPILYTPTFAHPDWTVKRKSGFLTPSISVGKETGITWKQPYFLNISNSQDYTITPIIFSKSGYLTDLEYRSITENSNLKANIIGGIVDTFKEQDEEVISGFLTFDSISENNWRTKIILQDSSEDSFLRKYKLTNETILKSSLSTQKLNDDSFSSVELYKIGSLSRETENDNSPLVLPSIKYERNFDIPLRNTFGKLEMSALELDDDEGHDLLRYSNKLTAHRKLKLKNGISFFETSISSNFYDVLKNKSNPNNIGKINSINSFISFGWEDYLPTKVFQNQSILKPQIQAVLINGSDHVNHIPNRDALDYRLDETNLFIPHRPLGNDLTLPGGRLDYGITNFINNENSVNFTSFFGQSLKLWGDNENEFQSLNSKKTVVSESDYIARLAFQNTKNFSTDWSARLDPHNFKIYESITTISQSLGKFDLSASHASISDGFIKDTSGAENLNFKFNSKITNDWGFSGLQNYNLHNNDIKLLKTEYAINYSGSLQNCMVIELKYERETKTDPSIAPVTEVGLIFQFKYLGDVIENL
ncbi:MAG: LPS-assembly protein LptD [Alphaproteobacteria bacterium]|nr:MAG: LPS-assembly protein LptD [Alphaproteobacteria bacterium]